jgi:uncharacterized protein (TIGR02996 family)
MPVLGEFLDAIRADPEDEAARLIFADWLEEQGNADFAVRAELLRLQCELDRWVPDLERRTTLERRRDELLAHGAAWLEPWASRRLTWRYHGALCRLAFLPGQLRGHDADQLRHKLDHCFVERVRLDLKSSDLVRLVRLPRFAALVALDLSGNELTDQAVIALCRSPHAVNLRRLNLNNNLLTDEAARVLFRSGQADRLTFLDLRNNRLTPEVAGVAARRLARSKHLVNYIGLELARIPTGTFLFGSPDDEPERNADEGPRRQVRLTRSFHLGVHAVTQEQFERVMGDNPSHFTPQRGGGPNHPVECVSWHQAVEFCRRLSELPKEKAAGRVYRLPTEAEWEHACRAGTTTPFHCGTKLTRQDATYDGNYPHHRSPRGNYLDRTTPVGLYPPNAFGLYDMHGNVWEWCADWAEWDHADDHDPAQTEPLTDPTGPAQGTRRVLRGGSWYHGGNPCRSAYRFANAPDERLNWHGFRVACDVEGEPGASATGVKRSGR